MKHVWYIAIILLTNSLGSIGVNPVVAQVPVEGVNLLSSNNLEELEAHLERAPNDDRVRRQYADALFELKRFKEAAYHYEIFLQRFQGAPDTIHRYLMAIAGYPGDNQKGERAAERYLTYYPTDHELYMRLGYFRLWQSEFEEAQVAFEQSLRLSPENASSQQGLVEAQAGQVLVSRLQSPPPAFVSDPAQYPQVDEKRFRFIRDLLDFNRYYAAYEQLMLLSERHDDSRRWLALYAEVDTALRRTVGKSPAYPIERYRYLLEEQPDNLTIRYALVDELMARDRIEEAYTTLLALDHVDPQDSGYVERLTTLDEKRIRGFQGRIDQQKLLLDDDPDNQAVITELIALYQVSRRAEEALPLYRHLLQLNPDADSVRVQYINLLLDTGRAQPALDGSALLLAKSPPTLEIVRLYTRAVLANGQDVTEAMKWLEQFSEEDPEDVDLLLDLSEINLADDNPERADFYLRKAFTLGLPSDRNRLLYLDRRIERALQRQAQANREAILADARILAKDKQYSASIARYDDYFAASGVWSRPVLQELAEVYALSEDYLKAVSILDALQEKAYSPSIAHTIARYRYYMGDHSGAIMVLEALLEEHPRDVESREFLQQVYLETQRFSQADSVYFFKVQEVADNTKLKASYKQRLTERINLVERAIDTDFVGLVVPVSQYIRAKGSITSFERWSQGLLTQVTLPAEPRPFMITAGLISHFMDGTRRLLPSTQRTLSRVNQITFGSYFDLSAPDFSTRVAYTNRVWMQFGVFDYGGTRTVGYADFRYLKQVPRRYSASIGARTTEGALALWSPAGGEFGLRLAQFDVKGRTAYILPDTTLRVNTSLAVNLVSGDSDSTLARIGRNVGTDFRVEVSYRVLRKTYLGLSFNNINYRYTLDTYFSPSNYQSYDLWVEHEREVFGDWFWRTRATTGLVSYRRGAFAARLESDLVYRFHPHLSFSLSGSAGYSIRFLDGEGTFRDDRFRMLLFSGAFYWTL